MKKSLIMGIIGLGSLFTIVEGVKAETLDLTNVSTTGQTVTVGEVDAPVYSVDITWGDLSYDYKYDQNTHEYYWKEQSLCIKLENDESGYNRIKWFNNEYDLYFDDSCNTEYDKKYNYSFDEAVQN